MIDIYDTDFPLLSARATGQINKEKVFYVRLGKQCVRRYIIPPDPKTIPQLELRSKWAQGVQAWHNLTDSGKLYWRRIGVRKLRPITSLNAFMSWWMKTRPTLPIPPPPILDAYIFGWDFLGSTWRKALSDPDGKLIIS